MLHSSHIVHWHNTQDSEGVVEHGPDGRQEVHPGLDRGQDVGRFRGVLEHAVTVVVPKRSIALVVKGDPTEFDHGINVFHMKFNSINPRQLLT